MIKRTDHIWNEIMRETVRETVEMKPMLKSLQGLPMESLIVEVEFPVGDVANFAEHLGKAIQKALDDTKEGK